MQPPLDPAVIDQLRLLNIDGEPDVVTEVLLLFKADVPQRLDALKAAIEAGQADAIQRTAHSLKGSAGNIGAFPMQALCKELELQAKAGEVQAAPALYVQIVDEFRRVEADIPHYLAG